MGGTVKYLDLLPIKWQMFRADRAEKISLKFWHCMPKSLVWPAMVPAEPGAEMKPLTQSLIDTVRTALKGAKLAKFDASIAVLQESIAQGGWILRGRVKANSGFYQGIAKPEFPKDTYENPAAKDAWGLAFALSYGKRFRGNDECDGNIGNLDRAIVTLRAMTKLKLTDDQIHAWVGLVEEVAAAEAELDAARPLPQITAIGLSPKVTATLTEMNLDIDLPSIRLAKLERRERQVMHPKTGRMITVYYHVPVWTPGIAHGTSRFAGGGCEACGKRIPSGKFVAVEAYDKRGARLVSLWLGCDCAKNIFGIKDVGIAKT